MIGSILYCNGIYTIHLITTLRQRRPSYSTPQSPTKGRSPSPTQTSSPRTRSPSPNRSRDSSPNHLISQTNARFHQPTNLPRNPQGQRDMEKKCGWCYFHNKPHNHTTPDCGFIQNAEVPDRWHIAYRTKLCQKCLSPDHYHKECPKLTQRCATCNLQHHPILGCRPISNISASPPEEAKRFAQKNAQ